MARHAHFRQQLPHPLTLFRLRRLLLMVLQRKSHILLDGQRIVKRGMLKQKTHFHSDFAKLVEVEAGEVSTWMRTDPESGFSRPMMSRSKTLLPVPLRPAPREFRRALRPG